MQFANEIDQEIGGNPTEKWVTISFTGTRKMDGERLFARRRR